MNLNYVNASRIDKKKSNSFEKKLNQWWDMKELRSSIDYRLKIGAY